MILDIAILALIFFFSFKSYKAGMANELMTATGWILSILIALKFATLAKTFLNSQLPNLADINGILGFIVSLVLVRFLFMAAAKVLPQGTGSKGKFVDKLLSTVFGFLKGLFFASLIVMIMAEASLFQSLQIDTDESITYEPVKNFLPLVYQSLQSNIPEFKTMTKDIEKGAEQASDAGKEAVEEIDSLQEDAEELIEKGDKAYSKGKEMQKDVSEDWDEIKEIVR